MGFNLQNLFGDAFAIATISFGIITWIIAIAGAGALPQANFPRFTWWGLVYEILLIITIMLLYLFNTIELYKFTLVGLSAVAFVYTSNLTNSLIYQSGSSAMLCCAAGCLMLSMLNFFWILYFGGHPESPTNQFIDSFSIKHHDHLPSLENRRVSRGTGVATNNFRDEEEEYKYISPVTLPNNNNNGSNNHYQDLNVRQLQLTSNNKSTNTPYMSSSQLNGLENFSNSDVQNNRHTFTDQSQGDLQGSVFRYKAKALYSYDANPEDVNEISFTKDEILEVDDIDGKWWQARRSNGQVGICPSNYVKLLDN